MAYRAGGGTDRHGDDPVPPDRGGLPPLRRPRPAGDGGRPGGRGGGILLNARRERFMKRYDPDRMELSTRDVVARAIATEVLEGRGGRTGGAGGLPGRDPPPPRGEDRDPAPGDARAVPRVRRRHPPGADGGRPPTAHHIMGGLRITPRSAGRPSRASSPVGRSPAGCTGQTVSAGTPSRRRRSSGSAPGSSPGRHPHGGAAGLMRAQSTRDSGCSTVSSRER